MTGKFLSNNSDLALVGGLILILLVLFSPIPAVMLDFLIILNFSLGITLLMLTFYVNKPVEFSTFPSLLLVTTLFRLALNVAATRLILTQGYAGDVINAIGSFAAQGNFVIGLVVFFILVVVQYVVVTSGAQRVSEVAARFVLDSVPGQQVSIDADLNLGLIDQNEAKLRRKNIEREAAFYGAMDGASKFVKGDAVASIIILLINIIAGWIIGISQIGLDWYDALQRYTLLTIGDGIVTQVPALIISVATGIIVTRSAQDGQLSREVLRQLSQVPKIPLIVMATLAVLLFLPGMPTWPILVLLALFGLVALTIRRRARETKAALDAAAPDIVTESSARGGVPPIVLGLGPALSAAWAASRSLIDERIAGLRRDRIRALGLAIPTVKIEENTGLGARQYEIALHGSRYGSGEIFADKTLALQASDSNIALTGIETRDPAFGLPATWVESAQSGALRQRGVTLVDPITVMMTHLGEVLRSEAPQLLNRAAVMSLLDATRGRQPGLIEELIPGVMSVTDVQSVLQNLVSEEVPIRNVDRLFEILLSVGSQTKDIAELTEIVRQNLSHNICNTLRGENAQLSVLSLDPLVEQRITENIGSNGATPQLVIEPRIAEQLMRKTVPLVEAMMRQGLAPVLLCGPAIRRHLKTFLRRSIPKIAVISINEVPGSVSLKSFGVLNVDV